MKMILYGAAIILALSGAIFFLQGLRLLPSPVMYGKPEWIAIGAGMVIVGAAVIFLQRRA